VAKRIWYSRTLEYFWDKYHREYASRGLDPQTLYVTIKRDICRRYPLRLMPTEHKREMLGTDLWYADYTRETVHLFFVEKCLKTFLQDLGLSDLSGIKQFLRVNGTEAEASIVSSRTVEKVILYDYAIHAPYEKHGLAFCLGLDQDHSLGVLFAQGDRLTFIPEHRYRTLSASSDKVDAYNAKAFRLSVNVLAYMRCFPECVVDGVPSNFSDGHDDYRSKTLTIADRVSHGSGSSGGGKRIAPHFRKGYFKFLASDFYTHKRGQMVFVNETMVNARAKTVHTARDLGKIESEPDTPN
jgi:hypothetical protein